MHEKEKTLNNVHWPRIRLYVFVRLSHVLCLPSRPVQFWNFADPRQVSSESLWTEMPTTKWRYLAQLKVKPFWCLSQKKFPFTQSLLYRIHFHQFHHWEERTYSVSWCNLTPVWRHLEYCVASLIKHIVFQGFFTLMFDFNDTLSSIFH